LDYDVAVAVVAVVVEIGAAEAGGADGDLKFRRGRGREGARFLGFVSLGWYEGGNRWVVRCGGLLRRGGLRRGFVDRLSLSLLP
jgi:hypothetical protein